MLFGEPEPLGMLIDDEHVSISIQAGEQDHGVMAEAVIEGGNPFHTTAIIEIVNDVDFPAEVVEVGSGHDVPFAVQPGITDPAFQALQFLSVLLVPVLIVIEEGLNEASVGFLTVSPWNDHALFVVAMAHSTWIGGGIHARAPWRAVRHQFGGAATGADIRILLWGKGGGFLDTDQVVFDANMIVQILLVLEMLGDDAGAIAENDFAFAHFEFVRDEAEDDTAKILEVFEIGLGGLAQEEALEVWHALAIVEAYLAEHPESFPAATSAAETDFGGAIGQIASVSSAGGGQLFVLKDDPGGEEVFDLFQGTAETEGQSEVGLIVVHKRGLSTWSWGWRQRA